MMSVGDNMMSVGDIMMSVGDIMNTLGFPYKFSCFPNDLPPVYCTDIMRGEDD